MTLWNDKDMAVIRTQEIMNNKGAVDGGLRSMYTPRM